jgi:hypothetical protein
MSIGSVETSWQTGAAAAVAQRAGSCGVSAWVLQVQK